MAVKLSQEKLAELKEAFMLFDYSKSGRIFSRDVGPVIRSIGLKPSEAEIRDITAEAQRLGGEVDLQTLIQFISQNISSPQTDNVENLREMFRLYDKSGNGQISVGEMRHLLTSVGEKLTEEEVDDLLKLTGCVQSGMVSYEKFIATVLRG